MYRELYQYLILHKQLNLPGIGTFLLERKPASIDFVNKMAEPPTYTVALHHGNTTPSKTVFSWLASTLNTTELEAVKRFNEFALDLKNRVHAGDKLQWEGLGTLSKGLAGEIRFEASLKDMTAGIPVPAIKVIREDAEHTVRVGEQQMTSSEMKELLAPPHRRRIHWWGIALITGVLALIFIGLYFSSKGIDVTSTTNQQKLVPKEETPAYKQAP